MAIRAKPDHMVSLPEVEEEDEEFDCLSPPTGIQGNKVGNINKTFDDSSEMEGPVKRGLTNAIDSQEDSSLQLSATPLIRVNLVLLDGQERTINVTNLNEDPVFEVMRFAIEHKISDLALVEILRRRIAREILRVKGLYKSKPFSSQKASMELKSSTNSKGFGLKTFTKRGGKKESHSGSKMSHVTVGQLSKLLGRPKSVSKAVTNPVLKKSSRMQAKKAPERGTSPGQMTSSLGLRNLPPKKDVHMRAPSGEPQKLAPKRRMSEERPSSQPKSTSNNPPKVPLPREKEKPPESLEAGARQVYGLVFSILDSDHDGLVSSDKINVEGLLEISEEVVDVLLEALSDVLERRKPSNLDYFLQVAQRKCDFKKLLEVFPRPG